MPDRRPLAEREIREITIQHLNLLGILVFEFLKELDAAGNYHHVMGLRRCEEIFGACETDACTGQLEELGRANEMSNLPLEAPVTMKVLGGIVTKKVSDLKCPLKELELIQMRKEAVFLEWKNKRWCNL